MTDVQERDFTILDQASGKRLPCAITGKDRPKKQLTRLDALRPAIADRIRADHAHLGDDALISQSEVNRYRTQLVEELLREEHGHAKCQCRPTASGHG